MSEGKLTPRRYGLGPWSVHRALAVAAECRAAFAHPKSGGRMSQKYRALYWLRHAAGLRAELGRLALKPGAQQC